MSAFRALPGNACSLLVGKSAPSATTHACCCKPFAMVSAEKHMIYSPVACFCRACALGLRPLQRGSRRAMGNNKDYKWLTQASIASTLGILMVVSTGLGYFFGSWLDRKLHTDPYLMLLFTILGVAAGFYELARTVVRLSR